MPRLRTTTFLSAFALVAGVVATHWLSGLTYRGTPARMASRHDISPRHDASSMRRRASSSPHAYRAITLATPHVAERRRSSDAQDSAGVRAATVAPATELVPLSMPADTSQAWSELRGHLDGKVILQVAIDGVGRVRHADIATSSGDPVLDEHALRSVGGWRFAVPPGHPDGVSGELSMRFSSAARHLADASE
jgi:protein TonB